jgi:hypothetical protein
VATVVPIRRYVLSDAALSDAANGEVTGSIRGLAVVSIAAWCAAVTAGRLLAYVQP